MVDRSPLPDGRTESAGCSEKRRGGERHSDSQEAWVGLQYEIARPAVAGPAAEASSGSDGLGRKARAAETPESRPLNKTTWTL